MKIHPAAQNTVAWLEARCAIPTASEFAKLVTPLGKMCTGKDLDTYQAKKLAEWWGGPLMGGNSFATDQGHLGEDDAIPWYELHTGQTVQRVGLCLTDDERAGCSPDGLIGEDGGLEIKCPQRPAHIKYLLAGVVPPDYVIQVQGCLYVTQRKYWTFVSYSRGLPKLVLNALPDPTLQEAIKEALNAFLVRFQAGKERLIELNGGEGPPKRVPFVSSLDPAASDADDIIP